MNVTLNPVGVIRSLITSPADAPLQGSEGAPEAFIEWTGDVARAAADLRQGDDLIVLTYFHLADRTVLCVHPRGDRSLPLTGVFSTRSPDRPCPVGLHRVKVTSVSASGIGIEPMEAVDGTPVLDLKPVIEGRIV